jgi:hypothetical protein
MHRETGQAFYRVTGRDTWKVSVATHVHVRMFHAVAPVT